MNAEEMWAASGLEGCYEAWAFGGDPDKLAELVKSGVKTATCSAYELYEVEDEPIPEEGEYSIILDGAGEAVCIIRTEKVYVTEFRNVTAGHAFKEGEGDRSLEYWREVHRDFFTDELNSYGLGFSEDMLIVCEEFGVVYR